MLVQLKMYVARKNFGKICLKAICPKEIPFFQYAVCDHGRDGGLNFFSGGNIQQNEKGQAFGLAERHNFHC